MTKPNQNAATRTVTVLEATALDATAFKPGTQFKMLVMVHGQQGLHSYQVIKGADEHNGEIIFDSRSSKEFPFAGNALVAAVDAWRSVTA